MKISDLGLFLEATRLNHGDLPVEISSMNLDFSFEFEFFSIKEKERQVDVTGTEFVNLPKRLVISAY